MNVFDRTKSAAEQRGLTISQVETQAQLKDRAIYAWKRSKPSGEAIAAVADVLHVSTDFLLGRTDDPSHYMSETERMTANIDLKQAMENGAVLSWGGVDIDEADSELLKRIFEGK